MLGAERGKPVPEALSDRPAGTALGPTVPDGAPAVLGSGPGATEVLGPGRGTPDEGEGQHLVAERRTAGADQPVDDDAGDLAQPPGGLEGQPFELVGREGQQLAVPQCPDARRAGLTGQQPDLAEDRTPGHRPVGGTAHDELQPAVGHDEQCVGEVALAEEPIPRTDRDHRAPLEDGRQFVVGKGREQHDRPEQRQMAADRLPAAVAVAFHTPPVRQLRDRADGPTGRILTDPVPVGRRAAAAGGRRPEGGGGRRAPAPPARYRGPMDMLRSATETAQLIRERYLSPSEVLEETLAAVDERNPSLNAVIWRNDDEARAEARAVEARLLAGEDIGAFGGVPLPVKDLTAVAGWPLTHGSRAADVERSDHDEFVVAALRRAGFNLTARTNTPELGSITVTENLRYGITRNPWDTGRTSGGSSGGAASAVASGMFSVAHANDGGGSIRVPASCTGLVGLKPSRGRVPAEVMSWFGMAVEGAVTHTVEDTARILDVISGTDRGAWWNAPGPVRTFSDELGREPGRLRIALAAAAPLGLPVDPACSRAATEAAHLLEALGHSVDTTEVDLFPDEAVGHFLNVVNAGMGEHEGIDPEQLEPHNASGWASAEGLNSLGLVQSVGELQRISRRTVGAFGADFDVLLTPTMTIPPPVAGAVSAEAHATGATTLDVLAMAAFTAPFNVSGQPAVSLPLSLSDDGLPIGVQLVAGPWEEGLLIALSSQLEAASPWRDRNPPG